MMRQSINLLNTLPPRRDTILPPSLIVKILFIFIATLAIFYFSIYYQVGNLEDSLNRLRQQEQVTASSFLTLTKALSGVMAKTNVGQQTEEVIQETIGKEAILEKLKTMDLTPNETFGSIFTALDQGTVKGAWVTTIAIKKEEGVFLNGYAVSSTDVMNLISSLNNQKPFVAHHFKLQKLQKAAEGSSGEIQFEISSAYGTRAR